MIRLKVCERKEAELVRKRKEADYFLKLLSDRIPPTKFDENDPVFKLAQKEWEPMGEVLRYAGVPNTSLLHYIAIHFFMAGYRRNNRSGGRK